MAERSIIDQLDDAVSALLAKPAVEWPVEDPVVASLVGVAEELRGLPREDFRAQLRSAFAERDTMSTPKMKVDPIPQNFPAVSARLVFDDASAAIEFYQQAFGAEETMRLTERSGKIGHAEIRIADSSSCFQMSIQNLVRSVRRRLGDLHSRCTCTSMM